MLIAVVWVYVNEKVIFKCSWFKQILKKIAFTISINSHVHPSSKQKYMQTNQFLSIRSSQRLVFMTDIYAINL